MILKKNTNNRAKARLHQIIKRECRPNLETTLSIGVRREGRKGGMDDKAGKVFAL